MYQDILYEADRPAALASVLAGADRGFWAGMG